MLQEEEITRNDCQPFFVSYKATHTVQSSSLLDWNVAIKERLCCDCLACKAQQGTGGTVLYQKIVVSYLVLMPLLASCPGSTIHGRFARVFCSDGSICCKTNANIPMGYPLGAQHFQQKFCLQTNSSQDKFYINKVLRQQVWWSTPPCIHGWPLFPV